MSTSLETPPSHLPRLASGAEVAALMAFLDRYEPVVDLRPVPPGDDTQPCSGGCGRHLSGPVTMCVRCRNGSAHPAVMRGSGRL